MKLICGVCKTPMKVKEYPMGKKTFMFEADCPKCGMLYDGEMKRR